MPGRAQRGNYAVIAAIVIAAVVGLGALAVDTAWAYFTQQQAQVSAEAAAMAGVSALDGTDDGLERAIDRALLLAAENPVAGASPALERGDVVFGHWDSETRVLEDAPVEEIDAVQVRVRSPIPGLLARVVTDDRVTAVAGTAVALAPHAASVDCFLPLALPSCVIEQVHGVDGIQDVDMVLNPPGVDNVGWMRPRASPSASWVNDQIQDCRHDGELSVGDSMGLSNGVLDSSLMELADAVEASNTRWDPEVWGSLPAQDGFSGVREAAYGNTWEAPAAIFDNDAYCEPGGGSWTGTEVVTGFVWVAVYDVVTRGPADGKTVHTRIDTTRAHQVGTGNGGPVYGVTAEGGARMVR